MSTKKFSELVGITEIAANDVLPIVDISDTTQAASGSTRKIEVSQINENVGDYLSTKEETLTNKTLTEPVLNEPVINSPTGDIVTPTGEETLTNKTLTEPTLNSPKLNEDVEVTIKASELNGFLTGWIPAGETWTYASENTIHVAAGATDRYQKGDKFKLVSDGSELQGYIVKVENELLTVAGDTLTAHTFTDNFYSRASNPFGFKEWFDWAPEVTGTSTAGEATYETQHGRARIDGSTVFFDVWLEWSAHTGSGNIRCSLPFSLLRATGASAGFAFHGWMHPTVRPWMYIYVSNNVFYFVYPREGQASARETLQEVGKLGFTGFYQFN